MSYTITPVGVQNTTVPEAREPKNTLNQQDFLKLMIVELQQQDPQNAADTSKFLDQLVNINSMTTMQTLNTGMNQLYGTSLLGRTVQAQDKEGNLNNGVVNSMWLEDGEVKLTVGDKEYTGKDIKKVMNPVTDTTATTGTN